MAQKNGLHAKITPPVLGFASELVGLLVHRNQCLNTKYSTMSKQGRESHARILPNYIYNALHKWAGVTKERMASALDYAPHFASYWSKRQRDRVLGANYNDFATKFTGFLVCHPTYDDQSMLKCTQYALHSSVAAHLPTATFLFLPNWANRSTNPYMKLVHKNPQYCKILGLIPANKLKYGEAPAWNGFQACLIKKQTNIKKKEKKRKQKRGT